LVLCYRTDNFDGLTLLANTVLLLGCAYETWAVGILSGRLVKRRLHILTSVGIILASLVTIYLARPYRARLVFLLQSIFYFLPGLFLFNKPVSKFILQLVLAVCYCITGTVFLTSAVICLGFPEQALNLGNNVIFGIIPIVSFCIYLISGFILLMLAKVRNDMQVLEIRKNLKESEIRYQQIVETAIEGILIFDENFKIKFANNNMASILGYTVDEMIGRSYASFFPESQLDVNSYQESLGNKAKIRFTNAAC